MDMRIAFHQICPIAKRVLLELQEKRPEFIPAALVAENHYSDFALLHAAACFFLYDDLDDCLARIVRDRGIEDYMARNTLISAIANAPAFWQSDLEYFYTKGLLKTAERYYIAPPELKRNSGFDTAQKKLSAPAKKILDRGIDFLLGGKKQTVEKISQPILLTYIAAQLMAEGREKTFRFSALSLSNGMNIFLHENYRLKAAQLAHRFAKDVSVDLEKMNIVLQIGVRGKIKTRKAAYKGRNYLPSTLGKRTEQKSVTQ
jgi:hypothetical protein